MGVGGLQKEGHSVGWTLSFPLPPGCLLKEAGGAFFAHQNPDCFPGLPRAAVLSLDGSGGWGDSPTQGPQREVGDHRQRGYSLSSSPQHGASQPPPTSSPIPKFPSPAAPLGLCPGAPSTSAHAPSITEVAPRGSPWQGAVHHRGWMAISSFTGGFPCSRQPPPPVGRTMSRPSCPPTPQCTVSASSQGSRSCVLITSVGWPSTVSLSPLGRLRKGQAEKPQRQKILVSNPSS